MKICSAKIRSIKSEFHHYREWAKVIGICYLDPQQPGRFPRLCYIAQWKDGALDYFDVSDVGFKYEMERSNS